MWKKNVCLKQKVLYVQIQATSEKCKSVLSGGFLVIKVAVKCGECVWFTSGYKPHCGLLGSADTWLQVCIKHPVSQCVFFGLEHVVIWDLVAVFVLNLVNLWGFCVCREPHELGCQYKGRSRGWCIFSVVIETTCVFFLLSCYNCPVWGDKSVLERKCHDSRFVSGVRAQQRVLWALCCVSNNASLASALAPA